MNYSVKTALILITKVNTHSFVSEHPAPMDYWTVMWTHHKDHHVDWALTSFWRRPKTNTSGKSRVGRHYFLKAYHSLTKYVEFLISGHSDSMRSLAQSKKSWTGESAWKGHKILQCMPVLFWYKLLNMVVLAVCWSH